MDTRIRSLTKAVTYRAFGASATFVIAWLVTGSVRSAAQIGIADSLLKICVFYLHERLWDKVHLGRGERPEYEI